MKLEMPIVDATLNPATFTADAYESMTAVEIMKATAGLIGLKLTAYITGVSDVRSVERWINEKKLPSREVVEKLRLAYSVVMMLRKYDEMPVVTSWLLGMNTELGDRAPIELMRESPVSETQTEIWCAAKSFLAGA